MVIQDIEYFLVKHSTTYHYQGLITWLYGKLYQIIQFFTPYFKWSRLVFNHCKDNYSKLIKDGVTSFTIRVCNDDQCHYYQFNLFANHLTVTDIQHLDNTGKSSSVLGLIVKSFCDGNIDDIKTITDIIYKGFIWNEKQAIDVIKHIKNNTSIHWNSNYCYFNTYWIDSILKENDYHEDELEFVYTEIQVLNKVLNNDELNEVLQSLNHTNSKTDNLMLINKAQNILKNIGYQYFNKEDFKIKG